MVNSSKPLGKTVIKAKAGSMFIEETIQWKEKSNEY